MRRSEQLPGCAVVEVAQEQEHGVGARRAHLLELRPGGEEPLGEQRHSRRRSRLPQVLSRPAEALVDEDRDSSRTGALERLRQDGRLGVGPQVTGGRRAALHLGDSGEAGLRQGVTETTHYAFTASAWEKTISASSRSPAAPESTASAASA